MSTNTTSFTSPPGPAVVGNVSSGGVGTTESGLPAPDMSQGVDEDALNDPSISSGSTVVDAGTPPKIPIAKVEQGREQDGDYFDGVLRSNEVRPGTQPGQTVYSSALDVVEILALTRGNKIWTFDDATAIGFGLKATAWSERMLADDEDSADVIELQTRAGAGSALSGFVASQSDRIHSVFATTKTLPLLLPALATLPASAKVIVTIATTTVTADDLVFTDDGAAILPLLASINLPVYFSSSPQDIVDRSAALLSSGKSAVHFVESTYAGRLVQDVVFPAKAKVTVEPFRRIRAKKPQSLLIVAAGVLANKLITDAAVRRSADVLVINDWSDRSFGSELQGLPVQAIVPDAHSAAPLREAVLGALYAHASSSRPKVQVKVINEPSQLGLSQAAQSSTAKTVSFYTSPTSHVPELLAHLFLASPALTTRLARFGSSVAQGVQSVLSLAPKSSPASPEPVLTPSTRADVVWITEPQILKQTDVISTINEGGLLVLVFPWTEEEVPSKLSADEIKLLKERKIRVFLLPPASGPIVEQVAFLMLYTSSKMLSRGVHRVLDAFYAGGLNRNAIEEAQAGLTEIENVQEWEIPEEKEEKEAKPSWSWDALAGKDGVVDLGEDGKPEQADWSLAARKMLFQEAFTYEEQPISALRPSTEDKTYLVTVTENRRLTPETYDRNVFHIAFDTEGTGLEYAVGEALGVHGHNDEAEVREFIEWYGLDADALVSFPSPHDGGKTYETRTVFQLLQQNLDIFGKPSKSFYASLAGLAKSKADERTLRFIAAPEGVALFKKMSEKETVTFADVLRQFKSARPSFEELVGLIPEIKPRHYSIASSQKFSGNLVELLVVTVDWVTPSGSPRYGQCTRYLANLPVGAKVTVSIKPSVMKLPPLDTQPIIMAGLGTGAAPFRAFIQHRAWQRSQGIEVGPLIYYFGSRYRSQEYLYGEELEAYMASGIITHAGLAFSRDGREKVYIQHKMNQDKELLSKMLLAQGKDAAYFYLCGPTWPVPDVYEALVKSLTENGGKERKEAEDYIEELKEAERYVLEVY